MIPREELPEEMQPHRSFYGKLTWYINGINPYPPGHNKNRAKNNDTLRNLNNLGIGNPDQEKGEEEFKRKEDWVRLHSAQYIIMFIE